MRLRELHPWRVTIAQGKAIQERLAPQVSFVNALAPQVRCVAGLDISGADQQGQSLGAAVVLSYPGLTPGEVKTAKVEPGMPYVPGFLSFREVPVLAAALEALTLTPDLVLVDGQGYAHPRRFGLACHLGLLMELPTIGCAKSVLVGSHGPLGLERGSTAPMMDGGEVVGMAVRTRTGVSPVYVSVGHKIDFKTAVEWVLACGDGYRVPEPTRLAHHAASGRLTLAPAPS